MTWRWSLLFAVAIVALVATAVVAMFGADDPDPPAALSVGVPTPFEEPADAPTSLEDVATTQQSSPVVEANAPPLKAANSTPPMRASAASTTLEGRIATDASEPIQGAVLSNGEMYVVTGADGLFSLPNPGSQVSIVASGYVATQVQVDAADGPLDIVLEAEQVNALYFNPNMSGTEEDIQRYIDMINSTSANAVVIDIKEEIVYFDSSVQLFQDAGTVRAFVDMAALVERFESEGIYTIARLVVFKDGLVAQHDPDLAVLNTQTGNLWRDDNGVAWVNPMVHRLWDANVELAVEAAELGFDEIQYDYVRFPTDGDFSTQNFGLENTQENREAAILGFLKASQEALAPLGVRQSADVFGYTLLVDDDLGIGQNFPLVAKYVDYISPMVYPSHWPNESLAVDGHPNDFPYETIEISMRRASAKLGGDMKKVRPWLQDFSFPGLMPYGAAEVRAQIEAAEDSGASGWMLWDPNNNFTPEGFSEGIPPSSAMPDGRDRQAVRPIPESLETRSRTGRQSRSAQRHTNQP